MQSLQSRILISVIRNRYLLRGHLHREAWNWNTSIPHFREECEALSLAEPGGYVRVFLNEGKAMQSLLEHWLAGAGSVPWRDYALRLVSQFKAEGQRISGLPQKASPTGGLIEPLTQRELEVLGLIASGRTNQEIANQLIVAPGTVKAHAASIYRKLDASNRTEAVARARQLGIVQ